MHTGDPLPMKKYRTEVDQAADKQTMREKTISRLGEEGERIQELDHERGKNR